MSQGWENHEPAPMEFFHGRLMDLFHEFRKSKTDSTVVEMDGLQFSNIVAQAKNETYKKYPKQNLNKAILKSEM